MHQGFDCSGPDLLDPNDAVAALGTTVTINDTAPTADRFLLFICEIPTADTPDTIAPTVSITAPAAGATLSGATTVTATASDNVGVAGVQFKLDGANLGTEVTAAPYQVAWNTTTAANGPHSLTAVARDAASNTTTSADYVSGANTSVSSIAGGGLTWVLVQRTNVQLGTSEIWRAFAPTVLTNATVTATLSQTVASMMTVVTFSNVDATGTNGSGAIGAVGTANKVSGAPIGTLITTRANSLVFAVGNDFDNPIARTVPAGQTMVHEVLSVVGDTYWVQRLNGSVAASGTTVTINATAPTGDRFNLSLCEIRPQ